MGEGYELCYLWFLIHLYLDVISGLSDSSTISSIMYTLLSFEFMEYSSYFACPSL